MGSEMCIRDSLGGFQHRKGENLFGFLFSDPIIVGLSGTVVPVFSVDWGFPK